MQKLNISITVPAEDRDKLIRDARGVAPAGFALMAAYGLWEAREVENKCTVRDLEEIMTVEYTK